jgi:hypothetical protein
MTKYFLTFLLFLTFGCKKDHRLDCLTSFGKIISQQRLVPPFHTLIVDQTMNVTILPDTLFRIDVITGQNIITGIATTVDQGTLAIADHNKCNWVRSSQNQTIVVVHCKNVNTIIHNGVGTITLLGSITPHTLTINNWSSGNIALHTQCDSLKIIQHVGVGDVSATGSAPYLQVYNAGNGRSQFQSFNATTVEVDQRSTNDVTIAAPTKLICSIISLGNVYYTGSPIIDLKKNGAGNLIRY